MNVAAEENGLVRNECHIVLATSPCKHDGFVSYFPAIGGVWDDHSNEAGKCRDCDVLMIRTTWHSRADVDFTPMRREQVERFIALEDRARSAGR